MFRTVLSIVTLPLVLLSSVGCGAYIEVDLWSDVGGVVEIELHEDIDLDDCSAWNDGDSMSSDCGTGDTLFDHTTSFADDLDVVLAKMTAVPDEGYQFVEWEGCYHVDTFYDNSPFLNTTNNGTTCQIFARNGGQETVLQLATDIDDANVIAHFEPID